MAYVTTVELKWWRSFSSFDYTIVFPAGTPVEKHKDDYWVSTRALPGDENSALRHDLQYHGCLVPPDIVKQV